MSASGLRPEVIRAAADALLSYWGNPPWGPDEVHEPITRVLEAAAPLIKTTVEEEIRQRLLTEAHRLSMNNALDKSGAFGARALRDFADLLDAS